MTEFVELAAAWGVVGFMAGCIFGGVFVGWMLRGGDKPDEYR